jgi:RNA polymerase sigma factor for flagellar operon FliA
MDHLGRGQRRQIKVLQVARERWRAQHGTEPGLARLSELCGMTLEEVAALQHAEAASQQQSMSGDGDEPPPHEHRAATAHDEVEARVDTGIVLRRLERFFASLPERERQVIDAYLGVGLSPMQLAAQMNVTPSRVSQMFKASLQRIATHFGEDGRRATDRVAAPVPAPQVDYEAMASAESRRWAPLMEQMLTRPADDFGDDPKDDKPLRITAGTRWG